MPLIDLSEETKQEIIDQTGILRRVDKLEKNHDLADSVGIAAFLTLFHVAMDYLVHVQFAFTADFDWAHIQSTSLPMFPALILLIYSTMKLKIYTMGQIVFACAGFVAGVYLIHASVFDMTFGAMMNAPGLAILWIWFAIQMDLLFAVLSVTANILYHYRDTILGGVGYVTGKMEL